MNRNSVYGAVDEYDALIRRKYLEMHRKMWNWIADETERTHKYVDKFDAFEHFRWSNMVHARCWACQYRRWKIKYSPISKHDDCAKDCIVNWGLSRNTGKELGCTTNEPLEYSLYDCWNALVSCDENWKAAAEIAREIANLPERR